MGFLSFLKPKRNDPPDPCLPLYSGGDGGSRETAVVIGADSEFAGVPAEYAYIERMHGRQNVDWKLFGQQLIMEKRRRYDLLVILLSTGEVKSYYFEITNYFGKGLPPWRPWAQLFRRSKEV